MVKVKKIISGDLQVNCYLVYDVDSKKALIADPGQDGAKVIAEIEKDGLIPEILVNTHGHFDHILSDELVRRHFNIPLGAHKDDAPMLSDPYENGSYSFFREPVSIKDPEIFFEDAMKVKLSFTEFEVIHTPGHTRGGICLLFDGFILTGDTLFAGTIGRTDFPDSDHAQMLKSLEKIKRLSPSLTVYPGHGSITTIANELRHNPFLR
ncbi:MAG: MBL fold metallo-hydrolase [Endomicrobium sp.]|jgi:glyoxylase-like metal-dependent hydrolase (beta-lactamase superfamily II)|nr:MBL fold metallo-hydrolase [Endomicrobium sp.]